MLAGVSSGVTVICVVPLITPEDAVIVTVPADTPVTMPDVETVATLGAELLHAIAPPAIVAPVPSFAVAESDSVAPTLTVVEPEVIWTDETTPAPGGPERPGLAEPPQASRNVAAQVRSSARRITDARVTFGRKGLASTAEHASARLPMARR